MSLKIELEKRVSKVCGYQTVMGNPRLTFVIPSESDKDRILTDKKIKEEIDFLNYGLVVRVIKVEDDCAHLLYLLNNTNIIIPIDKVVIQEHRI